MANLKSRGRCAVILLIVMGITSLGALWFVTKIPELQQKLAEKKAAETPDHDWKAIADILVTKFRGRIISIEQLNAKTCWAVLASGTSEFDVEDIAEEIGYHIKAEIGGVKGAPALIHVFVDGKRVAVANLSGENYTSEINVQNWSALELNGKYRP